MEWIKKIFSIKIPGKFVAGFYAITTILIIVFNDVFGKEEFFIEVSLVFFLFMGFSIIRWGNRQVRSILSLKIEKRKAELMHLKSQVNPHFFFNTLNNLYGLVGQDSEKAQKLILKLSDMMRYSIYDGQKEWVSLKEEIKYLENYIDLHQMRYHKQNEIKFSQNVFNKNIKVMPLLFIILLENAFKHGVETLRKDAFIHLSLKTDKNQLRFTIDNNYDVEEVHPSSGIGLKNLRRRLELVYKKNFSLIHSENHGIYRAELTIKIA